jgi:hypothetical protein
VLLEDVLFRGVRGTCIAGAGAGFVLCRVKILDGTTAVQVQGGTLNLSSLEAVRLSECGLRLSGVARESVKVSGAIFRACGDAALDVSGGRVDLENVAVLDARSALRVSGGARVEARHFTVAGAGALVSIEDAQAPGGGGARSGVQLSNSVVWPCDLFVAGQGALPSALQIARSVVGPATLAGRPSGEGVQAALPRYVAAESGDFRLQAGSPGKGQGQGGVDWGFTGFAVPGAGAAAAASRAASSDGASQAGQ